MLEDIDISFAELREWLVSKEDHSVGAACSYYTCPLATFFKEKRDMLVVVSARHIVSPKGSTIPLKEWQARFVCAIDSHYQGFKNVNAIMAIILLDSVAPEEEKEEAR
jgi:hypothetical protein